MSHNSVTASEKKQHHDWVTPTSTPSTFISCCTTALSSSSTSVLRRLLLSDSAGRIGGKKHVQVLNAMDLALSHQSAICVDSTQGHCSHRIGGSMAPPQVWTEGFPATARPRLRTGLHTISGETEPRMMVTPPHTQLSRLHCEIQS